ncbi:unnamed protein product [Diabrotica balteata]|uniref:Uncharacterized protein n=1 Tax=Diabrotica balteata TaxID=107213 RepID=A0A9N9T894_DIABA|nr:unnamed protein product [Diabrotica balteata]
MDKGTSSSISDSSLISNSSSSSKSSSSSNTTSDTDNSSQHSKTDPYGSDDSIADPLFNPPERQVKITTGNALKKRKVKEPSNHEKVGRKKLRQPATWQQLATI